MSIREIKGTIWRANDHLSPFIINGRRLDEGDLSNPASCQIREKVNSLYQTILQYCNHNGFLNVMGEDLSFEFEISQDKGIDVVRKGPYGSGMGIDILKQVGLKKYIGLIGKGPCGSGVRINVLNGLGFQNLMEDTLIGRDAKDIEIQTELRKTIQEVGETATLEITAKGLGAEVLPLTSFQKAVGCIRDMMDWLSDLNGQVDFLIDVNEQLSADMNSTSAFFPDTSSELGQIGSIPTLLLISAVAGMVVGGWLGVKSFVDIFVKISEGDLEGAGKAFILTLANFSYMLFSLTMLGVLESLTTTLGFGFYLALGLISVYETIGDGFFRYQLNQKLKGVDTPEKLTEVLKWIQTQAQHEGKFIRRTSADLYRRVHNEITDTMIQKVKDKNLDAIDQGLYLIELISKESYSKLFVDFCDLAIVGLGLTAVFVKPIQLVAALLAIGASIWLISGEFKIPFDLKNKIIDKLWNRNFLGTGNHHHFAEMNKALQQSAWKERSPTSLTTSDLNEVLAPTVSEPMDMTS